ncbi:AsmA family protein [Methylomarinum vadi]|uniref:AsmA family protein n=1 Tax=Methylomarinum vadi TaxID=438855 RepID=UPI0004DEE12D|nr:AsmA family protein [Methylomarinum vadi]
MGKLLKVLFTVIASFILLIIVAAVVLPLVIDPNDFKPQIQTVVKDNTGRELNIEGNLDLSVFPWIGVSTGKLSLSNAPGFDGKPFALIEASDIKVKLLPLLSKKVEVSRIVLKGLALNLAKNKQGVSNWDDLVSAKDGKSEKAEQPAKEKEAEAAPSDALAALAIGGLSVENASIVWDDQQAAKHVEIKDFNLETDELAFDEPMTIDLSLTLINKEPQLTENIAFITDLVINEKLNNIKLNNLKLDSESSGKSIPGGTLQANLRSDVALDLAAQTLDVMQLRLRSGALTVNADIKGTNIKDKPVFSGPVSISELNLAEFLRKMDIALPAMQDSNALSRLKVDFNLQATKNSAAIRELLVKLDDSTLKGFVDINNFASSALAFNLNLDAIDADRYLPSKQEKQADKSAKPASTPAAAAAAGAALLPVETLRGLNANGELTIGRLKINNLKMQDIKLKLNAANGLLKTQQSISQFYQGGYSGQTTINVKGKQPAIDLNEKLNNVQVEPLLQDLQQGGDVRMTGVVNANAKLQAYGNSTAAIKSTLNGNIDFKFSDGVVRGFNLQKMIDNTKALIEGSPLPSENKNDQTVFSEISGSANINNGLVRNDDLQALSSRLRVDGNGSANLVTEQLDYKINAKLIKKATQDQPEKVKAIPLILKIGGNFSKPSYTLDIPAMLLEKNKDKIEKKKEEVLQKLDEKLGPGVGDMLKGFFK